MEMAPSFSSVLKDCTVIEGQDFVLQCSVQGTPVPQITWLLNGESLTLPQPSSPLTLPSFSHLTLNCVPSTGTGHSKYRNQVCCQLAEHVYNLPVLCVLQLHGGSTATDLAGWWYEIKLYKVVSEIPDMQVNEQFNVFPSGQTHNRSSLNIC